MIKEKGNLLVTFRPGEVTGSYNPREDVLRDICCKLGGLDYKIIDPYILYSSLADTGFLVRAEEYSSKGYWTVSFYYPGGKDENRIRRTIINFILDEAKNDPNLFDNGYAVVIDVDGNQSLCSVKKRDKKII